MRLARRVDRKHGGIVLRHWVQVMSALALCSAAGMAAADSPPLAVDPFRLYGSEITFDDAWHAHRVHAAYTVPASCQVVTFPENATPRRRVFANAFLARAEAALADLEVRTLLRQTAGL